MVFYTTRSKIMTREKYIIKFPDTWYIVPLLTISPLLRIVLEQLLRHVGLDELLDHLIKQKWQEHLP